MQWNHERTSQIPRAPGPVEQHGTVAQDVPEEGLKRSQADRWKHGNREVFHRDEDSHYFLKMEGFDDRFTIITNYFCCSKSGCLGFDPEPHHSIAV